jgi:glucosamine-6-phosphate deaminase
LETPLEKADEILTVESKPGFNLISTNNYAEFCLVVAKQISDQLKSKADSRLALPAGLSPRGYYNLLAQASKDNELDWRQSMCFALDDYLGVDEAHTFQSFLENHLYQFTNLPANASFNPRFHNNYDQLIAEQGGIDLCVLGLGINGHIAFNEPPTIAASWTHCVFLTQATREANKAGFEAKITAQFDTSPGIKDPGNISSVAIVSPDNLVAVPTRAVTMGIATILASRRIILAVAGDNKKDVLSRALHGPPDPSFPASYLLAHKNLLVVTEFSYS